MAEVRMPQLGESVTEGTITRWFKQVGDQVAEDEVLFEVSTDKVDSEVPSPVAGFVHEIVVPEGATVDVGAVLAVVGDAPPAGASLAAPGASRPSTPDTGGAGDAAPVGTAPAGDADTGSTSGTGGAADSREAADTGGTGEDQGLLASPLVRRLLADHGIGTEQVTPTGPGGRITRSDVEGLIRERGLTPVGRPAPPTRSAPSVGAHAAVPTDRAQPADEPAPRQRPVAPAPRSGSGDTVEPLNNIRRRTGEHMVRSKATSPHAYTIVEVDYEGVERVRRANRDTWRSTEGFSLTYLPFIARAVVDALHDFPHVNATVGDGELVVHNYVNLSVAVDLDFEGLLAPVVHGADEKRLRGIAREIDDLATRARARQLSIDEITGGTFTLSNSGSFGTHMVLPIINQPQVAILSTDAVTRRPVVVTADDGTEAIAIHSVGLLGLSWDHRAFDGAYAAAFLRAVKTIIETRDWEAEL